MALYVAHYDLCRTHASLLTTPAKTLGKTKTTRALHRMACKTRQVTPLF